MTTRHAKRARATKAVEAVLETARTTRLDTVISLISRPAGATIAELIVVTGWQPHSVRGALSGAVRRKVWTPVASAIVDGVRRYSLDLGEQ